MKKEYTVKLREIVDATVAEAQRAYEAADEYCGIGVLHSQQEYSGLVTKMYSFPNCNGLLSDISSLDISEQDAEEHRIYEITSLVEEIIDRITAVRVLYSDLINLITYPHEGNEIKFGLLTGLSIQMNSLLYRCNELRKLADEELPQPEIMTDSDGASLEDCDAFCAIYNYIQDVFPLLSAHSADGQQSLIEQYQKYVLRSLDEFAASGCLRPFAFIITHRVDQESRWIDFSTDELSITVSDCGHVYDPEIGGDTYTNWSFTLYSSGETDGVCWLNVDETAEMLNMGARLEIYAPDEFIEGEE